MKFGYHKGHMRDPHAERRLLFWRLMIAGFLTLLILGLIGWRLYYLQVQRHAYYTTRSQNNRMQVQVIPPKRGLILDRNGQVLAENKPSFRLLVTPEQVKNMDSTLQRLSRLLNIKKSSIERFRERVKHERRFRAIPLAFNLSLQQTSRFEVRRQNYPGVEIKGGLTRYYPMGKLTAHIVGYVGSISQADLSHVNARAYRGTELYGKTGVENSYEKKLHGSPGSKIVETNAAGRYLRQLDYNRPHSGDNLYLTVDTRLQKIAMQALGKHSGAVVALNPNNGAILAMVSKPSYDPQYFVSGISKKRFTALNTDPKRPLFNRDIQGQYPPGSTVKPLIALAGLAANAKKYIHPRYCPGWYKLPNSSHIFHGWLPGGHGEVNLHDAIEQSCDVYFYKLAHALGIKKIDTFLSQFGLGQRTGIDLPNEARGVLPSPKWKRATQGKPWYPGDTLNTGIGQGYMLVTPLQLANAVARIATRGKGAHPHILKAWKNPSTGVITPAGIHPYPPIKGVSRKGWERLISGMHAVVNNPHGTAHGISHGLTFTAAGKTGTAQTRTVPGSERAGRTQSELPYNLRAHALFISFAPVDHPRIVVIVIVEHGGYGAQTAAPVARKVLTAYLGPNGFAPKRKETSTTTELAENDPAQSRRQAPQKTP